MDELDAFMTALEDAGILIGWKKFMSDAPQKGEDHDNGTDDRTTGD